jgi:hypothetical protein
LEPYKVEELNEGDLIPVMGDLDRNYHKLHKLVHRNVTSYRDLHQHMLHSLREDWEEEPPKSYLGFRRAPAAQRNHHNFEGGLVFHLLEMWQGWLTLRPTLELNEYLNDDRITRAILYHDLHKAFRLISQDPWSVDYANDDTDQLMTNDVKSIWILMEHRICVDPVQMNALLLAEGGYAKIKPYYQSVLAKTAYLLDELSGNVIERIRKGTLLDTRRKT